LLVLYYVKCYTAVITAVPNQESEKTPMPVVTYNLREASDNRKFIVRGTGLTRAAAVAEANAKLAMTVGTIEKSSVSDILSGPETGTPNADGTFSDANLVLRDAAGKVVSVHLENVTTAIGTGLNGMIDLTDPLVTGFASAYRDGTGAGGYTPYDGHFVA
jgi:hypothetical protein